MQKLRNKENKDLAWGPQATMSQGSNPEFVYFTIFWFFTFLSHQVSLSTPYLLLGEHRRHCKGAVRGSDCWDKLLSLTLASLTSSLVTVSKFLNPFRPPVTLWQNQVVWDAVRIQRDEGCEALRMACLMGSHGLMQAESLSGYRSCSVLGCLQRYGYTKSLKESISVARHIDFCGKEHTGTNYSY